MRLRTCAKASRQRSSCRGGTTPNRVVVLNNFCIRLSSLVRLMFKVAIAAIPVSICLAIICGAPYALFDFIFHLQGCAPHSFPHSERRTA